MDMINEMFQKQARRLEAQLLQQAQDRKMLDLAQTQLMILQQEVARHQSSNAQLQQRVTMSDDSVRLVRSQVDAMRENQQQARTRRAIPAQFSRTPMTAASSRRRIISQSSRRNSVGWPFAAACASWSCACICACMRM